MGCSKSFPSVLQKYLVLGYQTPKEMGFEERFLTDSGTRQYIVNIKP